MTELHPDTQEKVGSFISEVLEQFGDRLRRAVARVGNPRAGTDPMVDVDLLLVVDDLVTREMYRLWDLAGTASLKHGIIYSVQVYSTKDFEARRDLPVISVFLSEGLEYGLR